ncbi:RCC1 domain-containing protein 1-like isoform X4 [Acipenser ruthenus]|uniref:RCC1 domain-containing protein 1-like isoform X4 n=1 Tax=Acipenser ruthenus TaxID=7906 RepID=UPI002740D415|nr:RCC1 domain-containing protein 1-like isoform X4 [Acipenser ruthenus]
MRYSSTQLAVVFLVSSLSTAPGSRGVCLSEDTLLSGPRSTDLRPEAGPGHGQLGHGSVESQPEPLAVEGLRGLPMGDVAAGGWHSVCISAGGDLYVWGWNEAGQLGLPSRCLRAQAEHGSAGEAGCAVVPTRQEAAVTQEGEGSEVFISIQAFPALLDLPEESEMKKMSCGTRHTAADTCAGDLYTWGWGDYGQLGHGTPRSSDQPLHVEYFTKEGLCVLDVVCGSWNTFVLASERAASFE